MFPQLSVTVLSPAFPAVLYAGESKIRHNATRRHVGKATWWPGSQPVSGAASAGKIQAHRALPWVLILRQ